MTILQAYRRAWQYYRTDLKPIVISIALVGLTTMAALAQPFPVAILFNSVLKHEPPASFLDRLFVRFAPKNEFRQILMLAVAVLLLRVISELLSLAQGFYKIRIGYAGVVRVRCDLFNHLQRLSLGFHRSRNQGDLIYRLTTDTNGFIAAFNICHQIAVNTITLILMAWMMFTFDWRLAWVALAITPILFLAMRKYGGVLTQTSTRATQIEANLATMIQQSVATVGLVQAFGREEDESRNFQAGVTRSGDGWVRMYMQGMIYWAVLGICFGAGTALILGFGGYFASSSSSASINVGVLYIFFYYVTTQLYTPLQALSSSETELRRGLAGMLRVYEILDLEPDIKDAPDAISLPREPRTLSLEGVSFGYRSETPVLRGVSVQIHPGQMVAFVGSSGAGKTSLLNLLPRFYDPSSGVVKLDEHDYRKIKVRDLRAHVALVSQESPILPTTAKENIAYGNPGASIEQIRTAARLSGAEAFIDAMPRQFDSLLHEGGQNISGGQRQRIGIARALATEAPILILDEPTSALDATNERMVTQTLHNLKGKRTVIIVSHRLSTVLECDMIYMMEQGRIVESGTHDELLAAGGPYAKMARFQLSTDEEPAAPQTA
jgi:ABC-type multidrug transport system fused ATPase/permease subunit